MAECVRSFVAFICNFLKQVFYAMHWRHRTALSSLDSCMARPMGKQALTQRTILHNANAVILPAKGRYFVRLNENKTQQKPAPKLIHSDIKVNSRPLWSLQWADHPLRTWKLSSEREEYNSNPPPFGWILRWSWAFAPPHNFVVAPEETKPGKKDKGKEGYKN